MGVDYYSIEKYIFNLSKKPYVKLMCTEALLRNKKRNQIHNNNGYHSYIASDNIMR